MCLAAYDYLTAAIMLPSYRIVAPQIALLARNRAIANSTDIKTLGIYPVLHFIDILVSTGYEPARKAFRACRLRTSSAKFTSYEPALFERAGFEKRPKPQYSTYGTYDGHGVATTAAPTHRRRPTQRHHLFRDVDNRPPLAE